jgi:hypothetical protein
MFFGLVQIHQWIGLQETDGKIIRNQLNYRFFSICIAAQFILLCQELIIGNMFLAHIFLSDLFP